VKVVEGLTCLGCSNHKPFEVVIKDLDLPLIKSDIKRFVNTKELLKKLYAHKQKKKNTVF
jgi:hypothetical protein